METGLPKLEEIQLGRELDSARIQHRIQQTLLRPLDELLSRPSKRFRSTLVELGFSLASGDPRDPGAVRLRDEFATWVEMIHGASLIVDDIQDGSRMRRGGPALHVSFGLPVALNAGNWLYFWPISRAQKLGLTLDRELEVTRACLDVLLRGHFGQAIDVGTPIDEVAQEQVEELCRSAMTLKSGALTGLALRLGAFAAGASEPQQASLERFGDRFGLVLQMLDDIGNFSEDHAETRDSALQYSKRYEDLYLRRPTWIWAVVASTASSADYERFRWAVRALPDESFLKPWVELSQIIPRAKEQALSELKTVCSDFVRKAETQAWDPTALGELQKLTEKLVRSYF